MFTLKLRRSVWSSKIDTPHQDNSQTLAKQLGEYVQSRCLFGYGQFRNASKDIQAAEVALVRASILCQESSSQNISQEDLWQQKNK
jgi:hypothetical protein